MGLTLDENLSLIEKLQRAEERAVAAELLIAEIDSERNSFTGAAGCEDRDGAVERLIKAGPNLTAARELMRKAEECDARIKQNEEQYRIHTQNTREWQDALDSLKAEADTLRRQLAEAEALVEKLRAGMINAYGRMAAWNDDINANVMPMQGDLEVEALKRLLKESRTPAAALAEYRREVLEEVAKLADAKALHHKVEAENPLSNFNSQTARSHAFTQFAAEIRAMGEKP